MKKALYLITALLLAACNNHGTIIEDSVLPTPAQHSTESGAFTIGKGVKVTFHAAESDKEILSQALEAHGIAADSTARKSISFEICDAIDGITSPEGYRITTTKNAIKVEGRSGAGLFYAIQTQQGKYHVAASPTSPDTNTVASCSTCRDTSTTKNT